MKTDSVFYRLFEDAPGILFELLGEPSDLGRSYNFKSVEVKETSFRIDGVFVPKPDVPDQTVIFVEVQFQKDEYLYDRMFAEIGMYLSKNRGTTDWRAIAIFPRKSLEPKDKQRHRSMLQGEQFRVIYLEDFKGISSDLIGVKLMQMIISKSNETEKYARDILSQLQGKTDFQNQAIMELVSTVMVYKFPQMSREAIEAMFTVSELKQTKVYQEAKTEGVAEGEQNLVLRLLTKRFGVIAPATESKIKSLSLSNLEELGEALLDFSEASDLDDWLKQNP